MCWINPMKFRTRLKRTKHKKFHSMPVYNEKYIKVEVREFNGVIKTKLFR